MGKSLVFVLLVGCGSVYVKAPDANVDADLNDADLTGTLTVVTQSRFPGGPPPGNAIGNIEVVSVRPNGTMADDAHTDMATGMASVHAYPGGSVTALYPHTADAGADLATFIGVQPNDMLTFGLPFGVPQTPLGSFNLSWPPAPITASYVVYDSCSGYGYGPGLSGTITENAPCHQEPMDLMFLAYDAIGGTGLRYSALLSQIAFAPGGSASLPAWNAVSPGSMAFSNIPTAVNNVNVTGTEMVGTSGIWSVGYAGPPSNGQYSTPTYVWPGVGSRDWVRASFSRPGPYPAMTVYDAAPGTTTTYSLSVPQFPPWITNTSTVSGPSQMAAWFTVGTGPQKGTVLRVSWSHPGANYTWNFILPPDITSFTFPPLPAAAEMNAPRVDDSVSVSYIRVFDIPELSSYDDVRKLPESEIMSLDAAVQQGKLKRVIMNN